MSAAKSKPDNQPPLIIFDPAAGQMHAGVFDKSLAKTARRLARRYKCQIAVGDDAALNDLAVRLLPGRIEDDRLILASVPEDVASELRKLLEPTSSEEESGPNTNPAEDLREMTCDLRQAEVEGLGGLSDGETTALRTPDEVNTGSCLAGESGEAPVPAPFDTKLAGDPSSDGSAPPAKAEAPERKLADLWDALGVGDLVLAADLDKKGEPECWYEAVIVRIAPASYILRFRDYPKDGLVARTRRHVALLHPAP